MNTENQEPKIKAFIERINSGELSSDKEKILRFIETFSWATVHDMREVMGIRHQTLTSALSHLEDEGIVYKDGQVDQGEKERAYTVWRYESDLENQKANAHLVKSRKFIAWQDQGLKRFKDLMHEGLIRELTSPSMF